MIPVTNVIPSTGKSLHTSMNQHFVLLLDWDTKEGVYDDDASVGMPKGTCQVLQFNPYP